MAAQRTPSLDGITSLAILKVNWDERRDDYLEGFMPFLAECLRDATADEVSLGDVKAALSSTLGFDVPSGVVQTLLRRAHKRGYVTLANRIYYRNEVGLGHSDFKRRAADLQRESQALLTSLRAFVRERHGLDWSEEEADRLLMDYLRDVAVPVVEAARRGTRLQLSGTDGRHADYALSSFVRHIDESDPESFGYLENVAKGSMLASALYYENPEAVVRKFKHVRVYFDTPLLLRAIGVNGPEMQAPCLELFELLKAQGVELRVFRHTVDEIQGVLDAESRRPAAERAVRVPSSQSPVQTRLSPSDLKLFADTLTDNLSRLGVRVEERPDFEKRYTLDEGRLDDILGEIPYRRPAALVHDAESLTAIHRLRRGRLPARLEESEAVFVTTNVALARASREFFLGELGRKALDAPHCVLQDDLATRVWLKTPNAAPGLPRRQVVAHAYAALLPDDRLIMGYLKEIERLRANGSLTGDEYLYMRSADEAIRALADVTLNDPDAFTEATVEEVRLRAQAEARAEAEDQLRQETAARVEAEKAAATEQERRVATAARADEETSARLRAETDLAAAQAASKAALDRAGMEAKRREQTVGHIRSLARRRAQAVRVSARLTIGAVLIGAIVLTAVSGLPDDAEGWAVYAIPVAALVLLIQSVASARKDAASWSEQLALRIEQHTLAKYLPPNELSDSAPRS